MTICYSKEMTDDRIIERFVVFEVGCLSKWRGTQRYTFSKSIKMFIQKLQARNPDKLLQANIQSPTRIKISIKKCLYCYFLIDSFTETKLRHICICLYIYKHNPRVK